MTRPSSTNVVLWLVTGSAHVRVMSESGGENKLAANPAGPPPELDVNYAGLAASPAGVHAEMDVKSARLAANPARSRSPRRDRMASLARPAGIAPRAAEVRTGALALGLAAVAAAAAALGVVDFGLAVEIAAFAIATAICLGLVWPVTLHHIRHPRKYHRGRYRDRWRGGPCLPPGVSHAFYLS